MQKYQKNDKQKQQIDNLDPGRWNPNLSHHQSCNLPQNCSNDEEDYQPNENPYESINSQKPVVMWCVLR